MKRRRRHRVTHGSGLESATIPTSLQARQTAVWAFRVAQNKLVHNDFLIQNPAGFMTITAPYLKWSKASFDDFFRYYDGSDEDREMLAQLSPQAAWNLLASDFDHSTQLAFRAFRQFEPVSLRRVFAASQKVLEKSLAGEPDKVWDNVLLLQQLLGFSDTEAALLHLAAVASQNNTVRGFLQGTNLANESDGATILAVLLATDESAVRAAFKQTATLLELDLIKRPEIVCDLYSLVTLQPWCHACFAEAHDSVADLALHFLEPATPGSLAVSDFPHLASDLRALSQYLQGAAKQRSRGVNILIYGAPGTGKTAFAKALAQSLNSSLYEVANHYCNGDPIKKGERLAFLRMSEKFLSKQEGAIILFDEIEDVFPERFDPAQPTVVHRQAVAGKAWMNQTLENNQVPVIWISNDIDQMDPAYLRRFSYHLEIRTPPLNVRQTIARRYLDKTGMHRDFIDKLAFDATLTPALMESAARVVQLAGPQDAQAAERLAERVIRQCQMALGQSRGLRGRIHATGYSLDYLNLDSRHDIDRVITALQRRSTSSLCFYGLPGTGKTALAEHIATTLERPLIARRASELFSKWVGDAEKNLAKMFEQARAEQGVLLLDEADSFLRNREHADQNWEVSQVNELLQQMERFDGVFICATNLFEQIDTAALRRFDFKIAFMALRPKQRLKLFVQEALGGNPEKLTESLCKRLLQLDNLVPGDFSVVKRQAGLLGEAPTPDDFLAELENECSLKPGASRQPLGFIR